MGARVPLTVWDALRGGLATRALALAAEHGIAEALLGGPRSVDELAAGSGADPDTLNRLLRALASDGIFEEVEPGVYANTEASAMLTEDGWDAFARLFGGPWLQAIAALDASGEASFPRVFGNEFWSWFRDHPEERALFDRAMEQGWQGRIERLDAVGFRGDETVVDVGGGNGSLLRALLDRHPDMRGVVFDLPETVRDEASFGDRLTFVEGSFFDEVPRGDVHVLSTILHDWDDDSARRILETVCGSAGERLVLIEAVIRPGNEPAGAKWLDLLMLVIAGGRERTEEEWRALLESAGWEPVRFLENGAIEARPA
ncbi:MAG TPA: methyltransferase [Gaiellaceae bacterium]|nr:methyltransferase [Gaiellaceae bacterium]